MQKNCKILAINIQKWNIECMYFIFLPNPYKIAPIVYTIPPASNSTNPFIVIKLGNTFIFKMMHHPIAK